ncbi:hypothetical protein GCM10010420_03760 [Streptomyces glaucosporus]|uniref:Uncharacterized protein n=1 Tax=Streptomyces glaucosporus TaxID=284044 RepID=A0ABN3HNY7_9ACTN
MDMTKIKKEPFTKRSPIKGISGQGRRWREAANMIDTTSSRALRAAARQAHRGCAARCPADATGRGRGACTAIGGPHRPMAQNRSCPRRGVAGGESGQAVRDGPKGYTHGCRG